MRKAPLREWEDDSEIVELVPAAELQKAKPLEIYKGTDELIAKGVDGNLWSLFWPLIKEIRLARLAHIDFGEESPYPPLRPELLNTIEAVLTAMLPPSAKGATANKEKAQDRHAQWQADAVQIWQNHPKWSARRVALKIKKDRGGNSDTIRKVIAPSAPLK